MKCVDPTFLFSFVQTPQTLIGHDLLIPSGSCQTREFCSMLNTKAHLSPHNPVVQTRVAFTAQRQAAKLSPLGCIFIRLYPLPSPEKMLPLARRDREQRKKAPDPGAALC